jgi:hypothetical protein
LPHPDSKLHEREWEEDGYKLTTLSPGKQLIEIYTNTDDYRFTNIYLAEENRIKPLPSKYFGPSHAFQTAPLALFFAFGLYGLGRWLRHKYYPDKITVALRYTMTLIILGALVPLFLDLQIPLQFSSGSGADAVGGYVSSTGKHAFWVCVYLFLAVGCWATAFLRVCKYSYAINATAVISTLLIIFIPFGTVNFIYWFLHIREKDGK